MIGDGGACEGNVADSREGSGGDMRAGCGSQGWKKRRTNARHREDSIDYLHIHCVYLLSLVRLECWCGMVSGGFFGEKEHWRPPRSKFDASTWTGRKVPTVRLVKFT